MLSAATQSARCATPGHPSGRHPISAPHHSTPSVSEDEEAPEIAFWDVFDDIQDSYTLAMRGASVAEAIIAEVNATFTDFAINNLGDN